VFAEKSNMLKQRMSYWLTSAVMTGLFISILAQMLIKLWEELFWVCFVLQSAEVSVQTGV